MLYCTHGWSVRNGREREEQSKWEMVLQTEFWLWSQVHPPDKLPHENFNALQFPCRRLGRISNENKNANRYAMRKEKVQMRPKEGSVPKLQIFNMSILGIGRCGGELCHTIPCRPRELSTGLSRCLSGELFWDQKDNDSLPRAQLCSLNPFYHSMKSPWGPLS